MRRLLVLLVLPVLLASACGDDDGGDGAGRPGAGDAGLSAAEAERLVRRAQVRVADRGEGWELTAEDAPDDDDEDDELEECVGSDLSIADDTLAESDERTFERATGEVEQQQLISSTVVLEDPERVAEFFDVVGSDRFAGCIADALEAELAASAQEGLTMEPGETTVETGTAADAERSAHIRSGFTLRVEDLALEGRLDVVMVGNGPAVSLVLATSVGEAIGDDLLEEVADTLAARQVAEPGPRGS